MRGKSVVWIPVLLVGAMVYWTLAFGMGQRSLDALLRDGLWSLPADDDGFPRDSYQSITVNLSESAESTEQEADLARSAAAELGEQATGVTVDLVPAGDLPRPNTADRGGVGLAGGSLRTGPGNTAF